MPNVYIRSMPCPFYASIPGHKTDLQDDDFQQDVYCILKKQSGKIHFWEMVLTWSETQMIFKWIALLVPDTT